jgi:hypothetical protein
MQSQFIFLGGNKGFTIFFTAQLNLMDWVASNPQTNQKTI